MTALPLVLLVAACGDEVDDTGALTCPSDYEDVPLEETPPLPGDECADPPTSTSSAIEVTVSAGQAQADATAAALLDPGTITVVTCGTGSPMPSDRAQACTAVFAGGQFLLFDAGDLAQRSMETLGLPVTDIDAIFLTHFHSDHMADLGEVISRSWILGRSHVLPVYGGPAIERVVDGFTLAYTPDEQYRIAHHGEGVLPSDTLAAKARPIEGAGSDGMVVYDESGVVVRAYQVDHSPVSPALGFRVEYAGKVIAVSGDTVETAGLRNLAASADVLVAEVMDKDFALDTACAFERLEDERMAALFRDIRTYHIDVNELGQLSADAGVGTLVLTHMVPELPASLAESRFGPPIEAVFDGELVVAEDGTTISLAVD